MSYQDTLDKKETIKAARREMEHFSDLLKLYALDTYNIASPSFSNLINIASYLNADSKQLEDICKRDQRLASILHVYNAMCMLEEDEMLFLYNRYVLGKKMKKYQIYFIVQLGKLEGLQIERYSNLQLF